MRDRYRIKTTLTGLLMIGVALATARIWMDYPSLWLPIPDSWWKIAIRLFSAENQEDVAAAEFTVYFIISLVAFVALWLCILAFRRAFFRRPSA